MNEYEKPPFGSTVSIPYRHLWQVEVFTNCKNYNEWIEIHDKEIYNQALEDFKTELIKIYNKRYMHDIYLDDIRGIVEQLKR